MKRKLGVIGLNARAAAQSAKMAGFEVFLATYFSDLDTANTTNFFPMQKEKLIPALKEYSVNALANFATEKFKGKVDEVILTSKIGDSANAVKTIEKNFKIIGNGSENVQKAKSWNFLKKVLDKYLISYPKTFTVNTNYASEIKNACKDINFPCVIKAMDIDEGKCHPQKIYSFEELQNLILKNKVNGNVLIQEFIDGIPLSCSVLSDGKNAVAISINRQLIGERIFGCEGLKYCGNIVPFEEKNVEVIQDIKNFSELITSDLSLVGSNGIDFVINKEKKERNDKKIYFMEINPRIQDTLENVEMYLGINLVEGHIKACENSNKESFEKFREKFRKIEKPEMLRKGNFYGKGIIYAEKIVKVKRLDAIGINIKDVPNPNAVVQMSEPVCSIYEEGESNEDVFKKIEKDANYIRKFLNLE